MATEKNTAETKAKRRDVAASPILTCTVQLRTYIHVLCIYCLRYIHISYMCDVVRTVGIENIFKTLPLVL